MKKHITTLFTAASLSLSLGVAFAEQTPGHAGGHLQGATTETGSIHDDVGKIRACRHCGMDREKFSHSRILVTYEDGKSVGTCSIACLVTELKASRGKAIQSIQVGDYNTRKLIDARKAVWVIGGSKRGVMTRTAKWAFADKAAAEAFIGKYGGTPADYEEALRKATAE